MVKQKRVRVTCSNCGVIRYVPAATIARPEEHFLCDPCDSAYVVWGNSNESHVYVDDFLKSYAAKKARAAAKVAVKLQRKK
jgi:hypothetical protein